MKLLSRIWWGEQVDACRHRLWLSECGRCLAARRVAGLVADYLPEPSGEAERVARRVRERLAREGFGGAA